MNATAHDTSGNGYPFAAVFERMTDIQPSSHQEVIYIYAIQNIETGEFLYGTDFGYGPDSCHQRTSLEQMLTFDCLRYAKADFLRRQCGKAYRIVRLMPPVVERVIDFDTSDSYDCYVWEEPPDR